LLTFIQAPRYLLADKGYDGDEFRLWLKSRGTTPVIPNLRNRPNPHPFNKRLYKRRNKIERLFCRLKDARRIATRYDRSALTYLNAICLVSIVYWWLN
jgi:transposase